MINSSERETKEERIHQAQGENPMTSFSQTTNCAQYPPTTHTPKRHPFHITDAVKMSHMVVARFKKLSFIYLIIFQHATNYKKVPNEGYRNKK